MSEESLSPAEGRGLLAQSWRWLAEMREAGLPAEEWERILVARVMDAVNVARARKGRPPLEEELGVHG